MGKFPLIFQKPQYLPTLMLTTKKPLTSPGKLAIIYLDKNWPQEAVFK